MRAYIHAFQNRPWNEECLTAYNGFRKLGIECVLFSNNEELNKRRREDVVVGGMLIMEHALKEYGIKPDNYNYPTSLSEYLGRKISVIQLKDLMHEHFPVFVKPVIEKTAKGTVISSAKDIEEYKHLSPDAELFCSEVVHFLSEWRCFVRYRTISGIQFYLGDQDAMYDKNVIESAVNAYREMPAACSLDFGYTDDGRTLLIEMNDGLALGCYGLPDVEYAKLLAARWAELTNTEDIFKDM